MPETILEVEHLKKSYTKGTAVLEDISFSICRGEVVVLIGTGADWNGIPKL